MLRLHSFNAQHFCLSQHLFSTINFPLEHFQDFFIPQMDILLHYNYSIDKFRLDKNQLPVCTNHFKYQQSDINDLVLSMSLLTNMQQATLVD